MSRIPVYMNFVEVIHLTFCNEIMSIRLQMFGADVGRNGVFGYPLRNPLKRLKRCGIYLTKKTDCRGYKCSSMPS